MTPRMIEADQVNQSTFVERDGGGFIVISRDVYEDMKSRSLAASDLVLCGTDAIRERDEARAETKKWLKRVAELEEERDLARGQQVTTKAMLTKMRKAIANHKNRIHSGDSLYEASVDLWNAYNGG